MSENQNTTFSLETSSVIREVTSTTNIGYIPLKKNANRRDTSFSGTKNLTFNDFVTSCRLYAHFPTDAFNIRKQITASNIETFHRRLPVDRRLTCRKEYLFLKSIKGMYKMF